MLQIFAIVLTMGLIFLALFAVIYEAAWMEILLSRQARRRRAERRGEMD